MILIKKIFFLKLKVKTISQNQVYLFGKLTTRQMHFFQRTNPTESDQKYIMVCFIVTRFNYIFFVYIIKSILIDMNMLLWSVKII